MTLSQGELVALYFAEKVLAQYRGTPFEPDLVSAFRKIQGQPHTPDATIFRDVLIAQRLRRKVLLRYKSLTSRARPRTVRRLLARKWSRTWRFVA